MKPLDNPFYSNHLFNREQLKRAMFSRWNWFWLWLYPTYVQISDEYAWKYKIVNGAYWFIGSEMLGEQKKDSKS